MALIGMVPSAAEGKKLTINQDYVEAVLRAGGMPVIFPVTPDPERIRALLDRVDGLILTGGADVDPALYGEPKRACCGEISPGRDAMEFPLCREAVKRRMPVLAICRGLQVLSCALGGDLYQDLDEQFGSGLKHPQYDIPADPVHEVTVREGTLLSSIVGAGTLGVNSLHHQGIRTPGKNLRVNATSPDGLTEGVESTDCPFVLGVQWHPESMSGRRALQQQIFDAFVKACETFTP